MPSAISPTGFKPLKETALFTPLKFGRMSLEHRVALAPLTRMRAVKESDGVFVPGDLHVTYYGERASKGGFLLTEATDICKYVGHPIHAFCETLADTSVDRLAVTLAFLASSPPPRSQAGNG